jgi:hypothetical protein
MNASDKRISNLSFGPPLSIFGRSYHRTESIGRYAEHRVDGTQAGRVVDRQPQVAQGLAERPVLPGQQVDGVQRHGHGPDQQVADGQRGDEVVGRMSDGTLEDERHDDDEISADGERRHDGGHEAKRCNLPRRQHRCRPRHVTGVGRTNRERTPAAGQAAR